MHIAVYFENKLDIMSKRKQKTVCAIWYHLSYLKNAKKKQKKKQMQMLPNRVRTGRYIKMSGLTQLTKEFSEVKKLRNALISLSFEREEEI